MDHKEWAPQGTRFAEPLEIIKNSHELLQFGTTQEVPECQNCNKSHYQSWQLADDLVPALVCVASIFPEPHFGYAEQPGYRYGIAPLSEIDIRYYPYPGSYVYCCNTCNGLFVLYLETGGHAARWLARWSSIGSDDQ